MYKGVIEICNFNLIIRKLTLKSSNNFMPKGSLSKMVLSLYLNLFSVFSAIKYRWVNFKINLSQSWTSNFSSVCRYSYVLMINFSDDIGPGFITLATLSITNFIFGRFFSSTAWSLLLNIELPQIICSLLQFQGENQGSTDCSVRVTHFQWK